MTATSERERLAAYLFSIVQSAENSEEGAATTPLEKAYDQGILYAAKMLLDGADQGHEWHEHCGPDWADELRELTIPGTPAFSNDTQLAEEVDVAIADGRVHLLGDGGWLIHDMDVPGAYALAEAIRDFAEDADRSGAHTGRPPAPKVRILSWDHREQPDANELARMITDLSDGTVHVRRIEDTGCDQYAIVISSAPVDDEVAMAAFLAHLHGEDDDV